MTLPTKIREDGAELLLNEIGLDDWRSICRDIDESPEDWYIPYHFGFGMWVRNQLRNIALDNELPGSPECPEGNWDDHYVEVLEYAANQTRLLR